MSDIKFVVDFLESRDLRLSTAESCTCGLMASLLGDIPGCGQVLDCGFVVYSPSAKYRLLGVRPETVERYGLTSEEVAREMACGALLISDAQLSIANTGVADDTAQDEGGTQCFAYALQRDGQIQVLSETVHFDGDRVAVREQAARHGLMSLPERYDQLSPSAGAS